MGGSTEKSKRRVGFGRPRVLEKTGRGIRGRGARRKRERAARLSELHRRPNPSPVAAAAARYGRVCAIAGARGRTGESSASKRVKVTRASSKCRDYRPRAHDSGRKFACVIAREIIFEGLGIDGWRWSGRRMFVSLVGKWIWVRGRVNGS